MIKCFCDEIDFQNSRRLEPVDIPPREKLYQPIHVVFSIEILQFPHPIHIMFIALSLRILKLTEDTPNGKTGQNVLPHVEEEDVLATDNAQTLCLSTVAMTVHTWDQRCSQKSAVQMDVQVSSYFLLLFRSSLISFALLVS